jgi:hypothetical protein
LHTARQLTGLELGARLIADCPDPALREALSSRFLRLVCRQNLIGDLTVEPLRSPVGGKFTAPPVVIEANLPGSADRRIPSPRGSWVWLLRHAAGTRRRHLETLLPVPALYCMDPLAGDWPVAGLDAVVTDLSAPDAGDSPAAAFCSTWLGRLHGGEAVVANPAYRSCRDSEATADTLSALFQRLAAALKPGAPLLFGFQQDDVAAYTPLAVALLDAGLTCSASFPYPLAVDARVSTLGTVFTCRSTGRLPRAWVTDTPVGIAALVHADRARLRQGGLFITRRDERCLACAHLLRLTVWYLRRLWGRDLPVHQRLAAVRHTIELLGGVDAVLAGLDGMSGVMDRRPEYVSDDELVNF